MLERRGVARQPGAVEHRHQRALADGIKAGTGIDERGKLQASMPRLLNETGEIINWVQWNTPLKIVAMAYRINQLLKLG
jgi:hypothetical protein